MKLKKKLLDKNVKFADNCTGASARKAKPQPTKLHLYPNPATTQITLDLPADTGGGVLTLYDLTGKVVLNTQIQEGTNLQLDYKGWKFSNNQDL